MEHKLNEIVIDKLVELFKLLPTDADRVQVLMRTGQVYGQPVDVGYGTAGICVDLMAPFPGIEACVKQMNEVEFKELINAPIEAVMNAFAKVWDSSMIDIVNDFAAVSGINITTSGWFDRTDPGGSSKRLGPQFGVHMEEFREMFDFVKSDKPEVNAKIALLNDLLKEVSEEFKSGRAKLDLSGGVSPDSPDWNATMNANMAGLADSLGDQLVTATGVAKLAGIDIQEDMARIDWANFTKFDNGVVLYKEGGKVAKGQWFGEAKPSFY